MFPDLGIGINDVGEVSIIPAEMKTACFHSIRRIADKYQSGIVTCANVGSFKLMIVDLFHEVFFLPYILGGGFYGAGLIYCCSYIP